MDISTHLATVNSGHRGRDIVATAIEGFNVDSPRGETHLALVFEPMREPLWLLRRRLTGGEAVDRVTLPILKAYLQILLEGLDFLHSDGRIIHTGMLLSDGPSERSIRAVTDIYTPQI